MRPKRPCAAICKGSACFRSCFGIKTGSRKSKGFTSRSGLFDCDTDASIRYRATRTRFWSDRNYNYVETSHFLLVREGTVDFTCVPVDGSSKMPDTLMEAIEPYDYGEAVDFRTAYLSGFFAERYDVGSEDSIGRSMTGFGTVRWNCSAIRREAM